MLVPGLLLNLPLTQRVKLSLHTAVREPSQLFQLRSGILLYTWKDSSRGLQFL